ncbi:O-methyltransferase [Raoultella ornithinolytica]|jgi:predicted O-methyltransferase YrrM|uniref:O-methyltransferase n=1 Tax=Raoultella ornithinolytica TaxID=54291 RepID=A0A1Y6GI24_RAOOR|nr:MULTISPECIES: O-methyltransferase [Raoultella]HDX8328282.1 O-methyltransferase [Raoultella ornithinolytica CD1_MRS_4]AGJ86183.1 putative O-methyltransferase [Raoultella ornithinolytica B6]ALQ47036.1 O-methyltransferase [Raoultella ornithinolytica]ANZ05861.1 methyltransferase [Raoultella ornithinolytica]AOO56181.1 methyltransferase [Raoultella ornithinolytica]
MQQQWSAVDSYLIDALIPQDPLLSQVLANNQRAGLPAFDVAANQGQFLALLVRMVRAQRVLEIGTLGGYSTIWMARELPEDGELLTLEADPRHAAVARENLRLAGVDKQVTLREGPALQTLESLGDRPPFDLIFIDADKPSNPDYLRWALRYSRPGTLIIGDNVVRDGEVVNPRSEDDRVQGVRRFIEMMARDPRLTVTALQTVGSKGWDGFTLAWVNG